MGRTIPLTCECHRAIIKRGGGFMSRGRPMVSIRLDVETIAKLKALAADRGTNVAALIREAVMNLLEY